MRWIAALAFRLGTFSHQGSRRFIEVADGQRRLVERFGNIDRRTTITVPEGAERNAMMGTKACPDRAITLVD
jgi:ferredoxin